MKVFAILALLSAGYVAAVPADELVMPCKGMHIARQVLIAEQIRAALPDPGTSPFAAANIFGRASQIRCMAACGAGMCRMVA